MIWFELAYEFRMPVQVFKEQTTSTEFVKWIWFLRKKKEEELNHPSKQDWYLARIACEVANVMRSFSKSKRRIPVDKFLLKFKGSKNKQKGPLTPEQIQQRKENSKSFWKAIAGVDNNKTNNRKKRQLPDRVKQKTLGG